MRIADIMALVVPPVTDLLRRSRQDGDAAMFPTIVAIRNERVVAAVSAPRLDATLSCAQTLAVGVDAAALVLATEIQVEDSAAVLYTVMTRERSAKVAVQEVTGSGAEVRFSVPADGSQLQDARHLEVLADAFSQQPMDVTRVARRSDDLGGTFGEAAHLPPEQGRVVVDAGTVSILQERVAGIGGRALYVARSPEAGKLALEAGLPRASLLTA
ncbi:hypothetical protein ACQBAT_11015 [Ornithinimicrobium sp. Y1847]|uniref:hypothetical protein n=1 Tax=Ornithinimicrobium sp. Y1847 TaxID=3405419 RepID=UPI003B66B485